MRYGVPVHSTPLEDCSPGPRTLRSSLRMESRLHAWNIKTKNLRYQKRSLVGKGSATSRAKKTNSGRYQPDAKLQTEITSASDEELNALQSFCTIKINLIHHRANSKEKKSSRHKKLQLRLDAEASEVDAFNCTVPDELLNRIYFKNMRTTLKQVATAKQHISSRCPDCNRKRAELAQSTFLKQKKTLLESLLLQEKIDEHLYTKDFLTLIAEAHQGLPRLSDDPSMIWKRLNEKSQIRSSGFESLDTKQKM